MIGLVVGFETQAGLPDGCGDWGNEASLGLLGLPWDSWLLRAAQQSKKRPALLPLVPGHLGMNLTELCDLGQMN